MSVTRMFQQLQLDLLLAIRYHSRFGAARSRSADRAVLSRLPP